MRRHRTAALAAGAILLAALALAAYAVLVEPRRLTVTRVEIREGALAAALAGKRLAVLSDLHFGGGSDRAIAEAETLLARLRPDAVALLGDFVRWQDRGPGYDAALSLLARLEAPLGVFGVLGDSDGTFSRRSCEFCHEPASGARTRRHRAAFLRDDALRLAVGDRAVVIAGVDADPRAGLPARVREALAGPDPVLLLAHSSLVFNAIEGTREALVLAGDTHGGQVRLPAWLWRRLRYKPDPGRMYGLYREGRKTLFVTRGIGTSGLPLRFLAPPELLLVEFGPREGI